MEKRMGKRTREATWRKMLGPSEAIRCDCPPCWAGDTKFISINIGSIQQGSPGLRMVE